MKKKKFYVFGLIFIILIISILIIWTSEYNKQRKILSNLRAVSMCITTYNAEYDVNFPQSLDFINSSDIPSLDITKIKYTFPEKDDYSVNLADSQYDGDMWFYYPYGDRAWVCINGSIRKSTIPLLCIQHKPNPKP